MPRFFAVKEMWLYANKKKEKDKQKTVLQVLTIKNTNCNSKLFLQNALTDEHFFLFYYTMFMMN